LAADIITNMKTISVAISESDYEAFRKAAKTGDRSIARLIREAMAFYRAQRIEARKPLTMVPVLRGHRLAGALPRREELYDQIFESKEKRV